MTNLLQLEGLKKKFPEYQSLLKPRRAAVALDGVDLGVPAGRSVGVVGESGCGKSTLMRCILGLERTDAGKIYFDGKDVQRVSKMELKQIRAQIQPVFQDPGSSLNPRRTVRDIAIEPLIVHRQLRSSESDKAVVEMLRLAGLQTEHATRYPHQLSGGQKQRVSIARALILRPRLLIADEPTSALDVSVQAQILNLLRDIRAKFDLALLLISHNLGVVRNECDQVGIMYLGRLVEFGQTEKVFQNPKHPYTHTLISAIPKLRVPPERTKFELVESNEVPSPYDIPSGCRFHTRCSEAMSVCSQIDPEITPAHDDGYVACHLW